jgi:hypothetical protein
MSSLVVLPVVMKPTTPSDDSAIKNPLREPRETDFDLFARRGFRRQKDRLFDSQAHGSISSRRLAQVDGSRHRILS